MKISGTYIPSKWDEAPYGEIAEDQKSTKVSAEFQFNGDIEGIAGVEYLMFYSSFDEAEMHKASARYVGQLKIEGRLKGKKGSFVLHDSGMFEDGVARSKVHIVEGSGTGELTGIRGEGSYEADEKGCSWEMNCDY
jgi:hypothetical protein